MTFQVNLHTLLVTPLAKWEQAKQVFTSPTDTFQAHLGGREIAFLLFVVVSLIFIMIDFNIMGTIRC